MNKISRIGNSGLAAVRSWSGVLTLMLVFCLVGSQNLAGQVTATYDEASKKITITKPKGKSILFFQNGTDINKLRKEYRFTTTQKDLRPVASGLNFLKIADMWFIFVDETTKTADVRERPSETIYYYEYKLIEGEVTIISDKKAVMVGSSEPKKAEEPTPAAAPPVSQPAAQPATPAATQPAAPTPPAQTQQNKTTPAKPAPKPAAKPAKVEQATTTETFKAAYREKVNTFLTSSRGKLAKNKKDLTIKDKEDLRRIDKAATELQEDIEIEIELLEEKNLDTKTKCTNCDALIINYKSLLHQIDALTTRILDSLANLSDQEVEVEKKEYGDIVLRTVLQDIDDLKKLKIKIDEISGQSLLGWIGKKKIKSELDAKRNLYKISDDYIEHKQKKYDNIDDKALIKKALEKEIPAEYKELIADCEKALNRIAVPYVILSLTGIVLLILIIAVTVYVRGILRTEKDKRIAQEKKESGESGLLIEDDDYLVETVSYTVSLSDAKEKAGVDYYKIDMQTIHEDTSIQNVYFSRKAIMDIYKFFSDFLKYEDKTNETGCFLVGRWEYVPNSDQQKYDISIEAVVEPSDDAVYGEYNLNFGAKIGITLNYAIENLCEKTGKEYTHTAWMHSHPGLGLFLSSQDLSVQSQLAHSQHQGRMLAIVIDSNTPGWETAFFAPKSNGTMNNDKDLKKILSLETMYKWAKTPPKVENQPKEPPKEPQPALSYFSVEVQPKTDALHKVSFSGSAIIDMDMAILPDAPGLQGYFYGTYQGKELTLNDFKEKKDTEPIACFWVVPNLPYNDLQPVAASEFFIIYCLEDEKIYLLTKDEMQKQPSKETPKISIPLMEMKEWTRRKR